MNVIVKNFLLWLVSMVAPYLINAAMKVVLPLLTGSLTAVASGDSDVIAKAKEETKKNWKDYIASAQSQASTTVTPIDDMVFSFLANTEVDDSFVAKLFDQAIAIEQKFFRSITGGSK